MSQSGRLTIRLATQQGEFEQIHRLNYCTFVEEIPQHPVNPDARLVDRFHAENSYLIAVYQGLDAEAIVGMVAYRAQRPFSLDAKLTGLDDYLPANCSPCEIRLLAVLPEYRRSRVCAYLLEAVGALAMEHGHDVALISATVRELRLYTHLGFVPFGPRVGTAAAPYQPMLLTRTTYLERREARRPLATPSTGFSPLFTASEA
jgi:GNAT superfamily N-acetyltransferase